MVGSVQLRVWREGHHCKLDCKLVDCDKIWPLLGRKACLGMNIIAYLDNDSINKPNTGNAAVFALEIGEYASKQQFITQEFLKTEWEYLRENTIFDLAQMLF